MKVNLLCLVALPAFFCLVPAKAQTERLQELANRRQYAQAIALAANLSPADSADPGKMYALGLAYEGMLMYSEALGCFRHCFERDTTDRDLLNALARTEAGLGRTAAAEAYYARALAADSTDFFANYQLARLYFQTEKTAKALERYEFLLSLRPDNPTLLSAMGDCYARAGDLAAAASCYGRAYEANRENAAPANALVNTLLRIGGEAAKTALEVCDTALHYSPGNLSLQRSKAMTLFVNKKYAEADTLYSSLLAGGDSIPLTVAYGGFSRYYAGQYLNAVELLEWTYRRDSAVVDVCLLLGSALGKTYDRNRAYDLLDQAERQIRPDSSRLRMLRYFRAETLGRDQRYDEAAAHYYAIWKETKSLDVLTEMLGLYRASKASDYPDANARQRALFCLALYAEEQLKSGKKPEELAYAHRLLTSFVEDAFFRNETALPAIAPDGEKKQLSAAFLRSLLARTP